LRRLTILFIALTPLLIGLAFWLDPDHGIGHLSRMLVTPALLISIAIGWLRAGKLRPALISALIVVSATTLLIAIHLIHQTESGREIMWRVAAAIFR
jgi:hypothetical protein